jgi:hypothetical protein
VAEVRLTRAEAEGDLPAACMCCGAPATAWVTRSLLLRSPVVGGPRVQPAEVLLIRTIIALAGVPRLRLRTSFCDRHRWYWHLRFGLLFGGLAGLLAFLVGGFVVLAVVLARTKTQSHWPDGLLLLGLLLYLTAWLVPTALVSRKTIRVRGAEGGVVDLYHVGEPYVAALLARRRR